MLFDSACVEHDDEVHVAPGEFDNETADVPRGQLPGDLDSNVEPKKNSDVATENEENSPLPQEEEEEEKAATQGEPVLPHVNEFNSACVEHDDEAHVAPGEFDNETADVPKGQLPGDFLDSNVEPKKNSDVATENEENSPLPQKEEEEERECTDSDCDYNNEHSDLDYNKEQESVESESPCYCDQY